jgi:hypothetical protein
MNLVFPHDIPEQTLTTVIKDMLYMRIDFSIRSVYPDLPTAKTVKAVYMKSPKDKWFVLTGPSDLPSTSEASFVTPLVNGGDRFDCCNESNDVNKLVNYLLCRDVE